MDPMITALSLYMEDTHITKVRPPTPPRPKYKVSRYIEKVKERAFSKKLYLSGDRNNFKGREVSYVQHTKQQADGASDPERANKKVASEKKTIC